MRSKDMAIAVPAARSDGLLIEPVGDETVIYDTDSKQAHCLKPLAAIVFGCCDGHATVGEIASAAQRRLGDDVGNRMSSTPWRNSRASVCCGRHWSSAPAGACSRPTAAW